MGYAITRTQRAIFPRDSHLVTLEPRSTGTDIEIDRHGYREFSTGMGTVTNTRETLTISTLHAQHVNLL